VYRFVDHTAELALEIEAENIRGVFAEALAAFAELVASDEPGEPARHDIRLQARDRASLLVDWLEELVYLADVQAFEPGEAVELEVEGSGMRAVVAGRRAAPRPLVKAVTYHELRLHQDERGWHAHVVFDV
jgi:SHS2 domain-containing protein